MLIQEHELVELKVIIRDLQIARRKQREKHKLKQGKSKGYKHPPTTQGTNEYLYLVGAHNFIMAQNKWKESLGIIRANKCQIMRKLKRKMRNWFLESHLKR